MESSGKEQNLLWKWSFQKFAIGAVWLSHHLWDAVLVILQGKQMSNQNKSVHCTQTNIFKINKQRSDLFLWVYFHVKSSLAFGYRALKLKSSGILLWKLNLKIWSKVAADFVYLGLIHAKLPNLLSWMSCVLLSFWSQSTPTWVWSVGVRYHKHSVL